MTPQAIITGTGLITPLGQSVESTWQALLAGRFISDHARVDPETNDGRPRVIQLASTAAHEAIVSAGWNNAILSHDRTALIVGTSKGPIEEWIAAAPHTTGFQPAPPAACGFANQPTLLSTIGLHQIAESLAHEFKLSSAPRLTLSAACASGLHALIRAAMLIQSGEADRALVVAAEASVHPLFVSSFKRLGVLPPDGFGCRPFDQDRAGFVTSEAAAAICLENSFSRRACSPSCGGIHPQISRFALAGDATHLTGIDPSAKTLTRLLHQTIGDAQIDLIHAHGTGTPMNDPIELAAIQQSLPKTQAHPPYLYSHKGALGHTLGAAGLISIVLNVECHRRGIVPPNIQTRRPLKAERIILNQHPQQIPIHRSIALATGFGGPTAVICLENP